MWACYPKLALLGAERTVDNRLPETAVSYPRLCARGYDLLQREKDD